MQKVSIPMSPEFYYLITGASSGIGYATALHLATNPSNCILALARSGGKLQTLAQAAIHKNIKPIPFDLENGKTEHLIQDLQKNGVTHLNAIIHNAGMLVNRGFADITAAELTRCYQVNVFSPFLVTQALLPFLRKAGRTHVVHISSVGGVQGSVKFPGLSAYSSSKGALSVLTECLATELSEDKISVNCLALGAVQTEMLSAAFPGYEAPLKAEQMGEFVSWFTLNGHRFFNGKILPVALSTP